MAAPISPCSIRFDSIDVDDKRFRDGTLGIELVRMIRCAPIGDFKAVGVDDLNVFGLDISIEEAIVIPSVGSFDLVFSGLQEIVEMRLPPMVIAESLEDESLAVIEIEVLPVM